MVLKYYIVYDVKNSEWLTNAKQRNKTSAKFSNTDPPRLFRFKNHATQALKWWNKGILHSSYWPHGPDDYDVVVEPRGKWKERDIRVISVGISYDT